MELVIELLTVFGLVAVELWKAIPTGLALQLHPLLTAIVTAIGATLGMLVVFILGEAVQTRLLRLHSGKREVI